MKVITVNCLYLHTDERGGERRMRDKLICAGSFGRDEYVMLGTLNAIVGKEMINGIRS